MSSHEHGFPAGGWTFDDPENVSAICCRHVLEGRPILRVTHDDDDGSWQVLCGGRHVADDARVVCLGCMVRRDGSLLGLADLPLGWCAERAAAGAAWQRAPNA